MQDVTLTPVGGGDIVHFVPALAKLRITVFREWPYLYDGDLEYEESYLRTYTESGGSIAVLTFAGPIDASLPAADLAKRHGHELVGAATGLPLADEEAAFRKPFQDNGYNPREIFYCAESVLLPEWRGQGIGHRFFDFRERHARTLSGICYTTFCAVDRPGDHPAKPAGYVPLDSFWKKRGYRPVEGLTTQYRWRDIGNCQETAKTMNFWMKTL